MAKLIRIAIDAMGGDFAPESEIQGAILAHKHKDESVDFEIVFVGIKDKIEESLQKSDLGSLKYSIFHADEVVSMKDDPSVALKTKKNSSLYKGLELLKNKEVDAFLSSGNTGAVMSTSTILLGRINGVSRPTIGTFFPAKQEKPVFILDVGATVDQKARFLLEYAIMGSIYYTQAYQVEKPKIGLLNVGEEPSKGTDEIKLAYQLLKDSGLNFIGNIEGRDIFNATADVIICDGFTGNIILKFAESFLGLLKHKIKDYSDKSLINKMKVGLMLPTLKDILSDLDYQQYGGVPLLGVNGIVIIGHGKSSPFAIQNMIYKTYEIITLDIIKKIESALIEQKQK